MGIGPILRQKKGHQVEALNACNNRPLSNCLVALNARVAMAIFPLPIHEKYKNILRRTRWWTPPISAPWDSGQRDTPGPLFIGGKYSPLGGKETEPPHGPFGLRIVKF